MQASTMPLVLLCLWPLLAGALAAAPSPGPLTASLYLLATWGAPWLLARVFFGDGAGQRALVRGVMVMGLVMVPFALAEAIISARSPPEHWIPPRIAHARIQAAHRYIYRNIHLAYKL